MAQLAIKGHKNRGKEVIEILEMLGGKNHDRHNGSLELTYGIDMSRHTCYYYVDGDGNIECSHNVGIPLPGIHFTLEEFLEKYPYKIGDKVNSPCMGCIKTITSMWWDTCLNAVTYKLDNIIYTNVDQLKVFNDLQPHKEENMEEKKINQMSLANCELDEVEIVLGDKFELKIKEGKYYAVKKQPKYPKTYKECCDVLGCDKNLVLGTMPMKYKVLINLQKLLICRDAYWKIAGEEMGLGKPWELSIGTPIYYIYYNRTVGTIKNDYADDIQGNIILAFPTAEMRDALYENFKDLIEECKEFL